MKYLWNKYKNGTFIDAFSPLNVYKKYHLRATVEFLFQGWALQLFCNFQQWTIYLKHEKIEIIKSERLIQSFNIKFVQKINFGAFLFSYLFLGCRIKY